MNEDLLIEWEKRGVWYGSTNRRLISEELRQETLTYLGATPQRYYYPKHGGGRVRLSYREN